MTDIPMNRKAAAARALYDVPLLCRRLPGTAPALAELVAAGACGPCRRVAVGFRSWGAWASLASLSKHTSVAPLACAAWCWNVSLAVLVALRPAYNQ